MPISVVIPTCNRKPRLLALLKNLACIETHIIEVIIIDAGDDPVTSADLNGILQLPARIFTTQPSVCIQRNTGIQHAKGDWIFLCDDDIEVPADYLQKLEHHTNRHPEAGAVSGIIMQKEKGEWKGCYPVHSGLDLLYKFIFQLGMWGPIELRHKNMLTAKLINYYHRKGNHLSKAGWPVLTQFSAAYFVTPVYGLGASLVRKDWLLKFPFDEVLDRHGIGDNYGLSVEFPEPVHVVTHAFIFHHQEPANRLQHAVSYYRRMLALDYFIRTKRSLRKIKKYWLIWSLTGNLLQFLSVRDLKMMKAGWKSMRMIISGRNPYLLAAKRNEKVVEPDL